MAPKKPPAGGAAKEVQPSLLGTHRSVLCGFAMLLCLFLSTVWVGGLCVVEKLKYEPLRKALVQLRTYMISINADHDTLEDVQLILEAEKLAENLVVLAGKLNEIEAEIADLRVKLSKNWVGYKNKLYLFDDALSTYHQLVAACIKFKAEVLNIQDTDEERFIEASLKNKWGFYWIGAEYAADKAGFQWRNRGVPFYPAFWAPGYPKTPSKLKCAKIPGSCPRNLACWVNCPCNEHQKGICKKFPEAKWMT